MLEFSLVRKEKNLFFRPLTVGSNVKLTQILIIKSPASLGEEIFHDSEAYVGFCVGLNCFKRSLLDEKKRVSLFWWRKVASLPCSTFKMAASLAESSHPEHGKCMSKFHRDFSLKLKDENL